jgi:hypothetical protein
MKNHLGRPAFFLLVLLVLTGCNWHGETVPEAPTGVTVVQFTGGIRVSWNPVSGATQYRVIYGASTAALTIDGGETTGTSLVISGLDPETAYYFVVQAGNGEGWSGNSAIASFSLAAPGVPAGVIVAQVGGDIRVSWNPVPEAEKYRVFYGLSTASVTIDGGETTGTSRLISGLTPGVTYYFVVQAGNGVGWSGNSEIIPATAPLITSTVTGVSVSPASVEAAAGSTRQFSAVVTGTGNPSQGVSWSLEGGGNGTEISSGGLLTVAAGESPGSITVRATSVQDPGKSGTAAVRVTAVSGGDDVPAPAYKVGDVGPAGGYIFYVKGNNNDGWRYLETAPEATETNVRWGYHDAVTGTAPGIGAGKRNTETIMNYQVRTGILCLAAFTCDELSAGGYNDWFLPSRDELLLIYTNLKSKGLGGFGNGYYWSSSEQGSSYAYCQRLGDGRQDYNDKGNAYSVRAVRAFQ